MSQRDLYEVLGVSKKADDKEITKAYRDLARVLHPDKPTGDSEKFKELQGAYDVLNDEQRRKMYDLTGNTQEGGGPPPGSFNPFGGFSGFGGGGIHVDMSDIFGNLFGGMRGGPMGGGGPKRHVRRPKGPNKVHDLPLSLSDFYHGKKIRMDLARQIFCSDCQGHGCKNWRTCDDCRGTGVKETMTQIGPNMMAMNRGPCAPCKGEGRHRGSKCENCGEKGLLNSPKVIEIVIKPGASVGDILTFEESCSDHPDFDKPGDVQIRLTYADEVLDVEREGIHLRHITHITLKDMLVGCKRVVLNHPAHKEEGLTFDVPVGTQNGEVIIVKGKGMPSSPTGAGDLYVNVNVVVSEEEKKTLEKNKIILQSMF